MTFKIPRLAVAFAMAAALATNNYSQQFAVKADTQKNLDSKIIPFPDVLKSGDIHYYNHPTNHLHISWKNQDAFTDTYKVLLKNVTDVITDCDEVKALLALNEWSHSQRQDWERLLCETISHEVEKIPGLDCYRTIALEHRRRKLHLGHPMLTR